MIDVPESELHALFRRVEALSRNAEICRLHVGEPAFSPPASVGAALAAAARCGCPYSDTQGSEELRRALLTRVAADGVEASLEDVFVTPGSSEGLVAVFHAVAAPAAEILVPELHWPLYRPQLTVAGLRPRWYPVAADGSIDPEAVAAAGSKHTVALLVNSPANPTGAMLGAAGARALVELCHHRGWALISDEAYRDFAYRGEHVSPASFEATLPAAERRVFTLDTLSKSYAMTGYRVGFVVAPRPAVRALRAIQDAILVAPSFPLQLAAVAALRAGPPVEAIELLRRNRELFRPLVEAALLPDLPAGGWYAFVSTRALGLDGDQAAERLLERGIAVAPGRCFAATDRGRSAIRIAMCAATQEIERGIAAVLALVRSRERGGH